MKTNRIRQSFADWCATKGLSDAEAAVLYQQAAQAGYVAVEMAPRHRWAAAREAGLILLNVGAPGMDAGLNHRKNHAALLPQITELIEVAAHEKIAQIIVFSGKREGQSDAEGVRCCVEALSTLAPLAETKGVTLLLELLGQTVHPDYHVDNIGLGVKIIRTVGSPAVKLLYDIYHMDSMGEAVVPAIIEHLEDIGHLHVASPNGRGEPLASDALPHGSIVAQVMDAGYRGIWGQEFLVQGNAIEALRRAFKLFDSF